MSKREIIAYAITHAPRGVKGGPYTGNGSTAHQVPSMALARRYALDDLHEAQADVAWLVRNEYTARVIRIVRAPPSEASATPPIGHRDGGRLETARRLLAAVAEHMTEHACHETGEPVREEGRDWEPLIEERYTLPHAAKEGHERHVHRLELAEALAISEQLGTPESMREVERLEALVLS